MSEIIDNNFVNGDVTNIVPGSLYFPGSRCTLINKKLLKICRQEYFIMRQLSDLTGQNIFDHAAFIDTISINDLIKNDYNLLSRKNNYVGDRYKQFFIENKIYQKYKSIFNTDRNREMFSVVPSYADIFNGFIKTPNYFILLNGSDERFPVYVLSNSMENDIKIDGIEEKIEFYGFFLIGYLVDYNPYQSNTLSIFENKFKFKLDNRTRTLFGTNRFIKYDNKLFYINLNNCFEKTEIKFDRLTKKFDNIRLIKNINDATTDEEKEIAMKQNEDFINNIDNGFLYLGCVEKLSAPHENTVITKQVRLLYLLINYEKKDGINYSLTLWEKIIFNGNVDKMLKLYLNEELNGDLDELRRREGEINILDPVKIIYTMKMVEEL